MRHRRERSRRGNSPLPLSGPFSCEGQFAGISAAMEYADLRVLEAVARHGSMNRAAAELHTVQSNVTARIRALEEQIGTALFERNSRGVVLTAAGQRLLPYAARLGAILKEATDAALTTGRRVDRFVSARLRPRRHFACRRSFPPMPRRIPKSA